MGGGGGRRDIATCAIQLAREAKMDARSRINKAPGRRTFFYIHICTYIHLSIYIFSPSLHFFFFLPCLSSAKLRKETAFRRKFRSKNVVLRLAKQVIKWNSIRHRDHFEVLLNLSFQCLELF